MTRICLIAAGLLLFATVAGVFLGFFFENRFDYVMLDGVSRHEWIRRYEEGSPTEHIEARRAFVRMGEPAVPFLIEQIHAGPNPRRDEAVAILAEISAPAVPELIAYVLKEKDRSKSDPAIVAMGQIGSPAVEPAIALWQTRDLSSRNVARRILQACGPAAEPAISHLMKSWDERIWRNDIIPLLCSIGPAAFPNLLELFEFEPEYRRTIAVHLADLGPSASAALPMLADWAEFCPEAEREDVLRAISNLQPS